MLVDQQGGEKLKHNCNPFLVVLFFWGLHDPGYLTRGGVGMNLLKQPAGQWSPTIDPRIC